MSLLFVAALTIYVVVYMGARSAYQAGSQAI